MSPSEAGFIVFSVGSAIKMNEMPEEVLQFFIKAFSRIPQRVIWQWNGTPRDDLPETVKMVPWLPQQDLLDTRCNFKRNLFESKINLIEKVTVTAGYSSHTVDSTVYKKLSIGLVVYI